MQLFHIEDHPLTFMRSISQAAFFQTFTSAHKILILRDYTPDPKIGQRLEYINNALYSMTVDYIRHNAVLIFGIIEDVLF